MAWSKLEGKVQAVVVTVGVIAIFGIGLANQILIDYINTGIHHRRFERVDARAGKFNDQISYFSRRNHPISEYRGPTGTVRISPSLALAFKLVTVGPSTGQG
jgi:hypothetical protein